MATQGQPGLAPWGAVDDPAAPVSGSPPGTGGGSQPVYPHAAGAPAADPLAAGAPAADAAAPRRRRWWSIAADPELPPIGARRAYTEALLVYAAFFLVGIVAAGVVFGGHSEDVTTNGSWGTYMTGAVSTVAEMGVAVALVLLLGARRGVTRFSLGLVVPRTPDGRLGVSRTIRVAAWCFFAIVAGNVIVALLQTGKLPTTTSSAPDLIFSVFRAADAGVVEELVVLAFLVVTLRQAGRPWWEVTVVALVCRAAYHIYYGPGVVGILLWAALFYWIYLRFRQVGVMIVCHALWDAVVFLSRATVVIAEVGELVIVGLWIVSGIMWLVERGNRTVPGAVGPAWPAVPSGPPPWAVEGAWPGVGYGSDQAGRPGPAAAPPAPSFQYQAQQQPPWRPAVPASPNPPPGWHPDPSGVNRWRWWDGYRWTEHVSSHS